MVTESIGLAVVIGIVIGVAGIAAIVGLCKLATWSYNITEKIRVLQGDLKFGRRWRDDRRTALENTVKELKKSSDDYLEHGKIVIETLALTHSRLEALEKFEREVEEKLNEN